MYREKSPSVISPDFYYLFSIVAHFWRYGENEIGISLQISMGVDISALFVIG